MYKGGHPSDSAKFTTPAEALNLSEKMQLQWRDSDMQNANIIAAADRKRDNRIIALQCAVEYSKESLDGYNAAVEIIAKRFEKYLEHGE